MKIALVFGLLVVGGCAEDAAEALPTHDSVPTIDAGAEPVPPIESDSGFPGAETSTPDAPSDGTKNSDKQYNTCPADPLGPQNDDDSGLAPGPIIRITIKVLAIYASGGGFRPIEKDATGRTIVEVGDSFVLDATQKNSPPPSGPESICQWQTLPEWFAEDPACAFRRTQESNPWLFDATVLESGTLDVFVVGDGVTSNTLELVASP